MGTNIRLRRGNKTDLPTSAPSGTPLWCEDTEELYVGTGASVTKVGSENLANSTDNTNVLNPVGVNPHDTSSLKRNTAVSIEGGNVSANAFIGNLLGKSTSAEKLEVARTIELTGHVAGSGVFDGSGNLTLDTKIDGDPFPLFATMTVDKNLESEESVGWLEQGSLVTEVYPDAVAAIVSEYNNGIAKTHLVEEHWIQPLLAANGSLGGSSFAVAASSEYSTSYQAYMAFRGDDETSYWHSASASTWFLTFYNPTALKVSKLDVTIHSTSHIPSGGKLQGSNDGTTWTDVCTFVNNQFIIRLTNDLF